MISVILDVSDAERARLIAYAREAGRSVDDVVRDATLAMVDAAMATARRPGSMRWERVAEDSES